jgi:hypothetical protein
VTAFDRMNKIIRMEEAPEKYDLAGKVIGFAMKIHSTLGSGFLESNEGLLLNFGAERLEFKKKFRRPKPESVSL